MRRGWLALALLIALVGLAGWHGAALHGLTGELTGLLTQAEARAEAGDWTEAAGLTRRASERWEGKHFYLHATLEHDVTDQIACGFAETLELLQCQEAGEYSAANARLVKQLELLGDMERPLLENLL